MIRGLLNRSAFLVLLALGGMPLLRAPEAASQAFFRISSATPTTITGFDHEGVLHWSNAVTSGAYQIEHSTDAASDWQPFTQGRFTNQQWSLRLLELSGPEGMVYLPGGRFDIGDAMNDPFVAPVARPVHSVIVSPFFIDRFEVTNRRLRDLLQWAFDKNLITFVGDDLVSTEGPTNVLVSLGKYNSEIFYDADGFQVKPGRENFPGEYISWFGAVALCNYRSLMEHKEPAYKLATWECDFSKSAYRLPTEAEWEFAARGGHSGHRFPWVDSDLITHARANYRSDTNTTYDVSPTREYHPDYTNLRPRSSPVGTFAPNRFGLFDMAGNVWEWTWDWWARYPSTEQTDPTGPPTGESRVFRGGSWFTKSERLTCAMRYPAKPTITFDDIGFRMILPDRRVVPSSARP